MYQDILYTLDVPAVGSPIKGVSKASNSLIQTCMLVEVRPLGKVKDTDAFRCENRHGAAYLVYVLPAAAQASDRHHRRVDAMCRAGHDPEHMCFDPHCSRLRSGRRADHPEATLIQLRKLLFWLAAISVLFGAQGTFGLQLWDLFISLVKLLLQT